MRPLEPRQQALLLLTIALLLRCIGVARTAVIFNDGPIFLHIADLIGQGAWREALAHAYHPLYPLCIAGLSALGVEPESAAVAISVVAGSLAVVALYAFLCLAFDRTIGFVGAMILALHPYAIRFSADVQSDGLYLALFLASVATLYAALERADARLAVLAGALSGLGYLARPEGIGTAIVGALLLVVASLRGSWSAVLALRVATGIVFGVLISALPYWIALSRLVGEWRFSQKKSVLDMLGLGSTGHLEEGVAGELGVGAGLIVLTLGLCALVGLVRSRRSETALRARLSALRRQRLGVGGFVALVGVGAFVVIVASPSLTLQLATDVVSTLRPELLLLLAVGVAARARAGPQGRSLFIATLLALYAFVLFGLLIEYGYLSRRHTLPPLTLTFGYVALGGLFLVERLEGAIPGIGRAGWIAALLVALALISFPKAFHDHRGEELAGRRAAEWMREAQLGAGDVASSKSKLGYYADRDWQPLHWQHALRRLADLESTGVRFLILEEDALDDGLSPIVPLAANRAFALRERHRAEANERHAIVFEIEALH